jgi:hypothetical protein
MYDQDFGVKSYYVLEALDQNGYQHSSCIEVDVGAIIKF